MNPDFYITSVHVHVGVLMYNSHDTAHNMT